MKNVCGAKRLKKQFKQEFLFHLMLFPALVIILIYSYAPMFGLVMAFQNFKPTQGIWGSKWVGLEQFTRLLHYRGIGRIIFNTVFIAFFKIVLGIVVPVMFALMVNMVKNKYVSGFIQTVTCLPNFISWVILGGIFSNLLSPSMGLVNSVIKLFGGEPLFFLGDNRFFPWTIIITDAWKGFGYSSIIYLAAMSAIDTNLYDAAKVDGAGRFKQMWHVTLPGILPMIFVMSVMSLAGILNAGFDQVLNMYNDMVKDSGEILDTFVYKMGLKNSQYSFSTAVGLVKSIIGLILVLIGYKLADKYGNYRVF